MRADFITVEHFEKFTDPQKLELAGRITTAISDLDTVSAEKKAVDAGFNERTKTLENTVSELTKQFVKGGSSSPVRCSIRYDIPVIGKKSYVREGTEELLGVYDMTLEERQETLQFPLTEQKATEPEPPAPPKPPEMPPAPPEIAYRYVADVAAVIATLPADQVSQAIEEMAAKLAERVLAQGKITQKNGKAKKVKDLEQAKELMSDWLTALVLTDQERQEETRQGEEPEPRPFCKKSDGCTLTAGHDGPCDIAPIEEPPTEHPDASV